MNTRAPVVLEQASEEPRRDDRPSTSERPTLGETLQAVVPLIGAPAFFGPPVIFVLGPWLVLVLMLIGPVALLITLVLVAIAAASLLVALVALIASPYLLVHHLRARHAVHRSAPAPAVSATADARGRRPVRQAVGSRLIHLTTH